jgi:hypothetical protein
MARLQLLLTDERKKINGPSCGIIDKALRALFSKFDSWATLSRGPYDFVTAEGSQENGLTLECEMGSDDAHYRAKKRLDIDAVIRVFQSYARQEEASWFSDFNWERVNLKDIDRKRAPENEVLGAYWFWGRIP